MKGKYLPIGTVVRLKSGTKRMMIIGFMATVSKEDSTIYDYIGCLYPEGFISADNLLLFQHEQVEEIYNEAFEDEDFRKLCLMLLDNNKDRLLYYPAASKNHHAELAGLLYHEKRMLMTAERVCEVYTNLDREMLMTGVIIHDIEKLNEIESNEQGISPGYSFEGKMLGHLVMGVRELDKLTTEIGMSREKAVMLEHMMLSHHYEPEFGSPKKPLFPEAEMLHYLDMIDAKMFDMEEALEKTEPGCFSERVWTLDNRTIYKRNQ